MPTLKSEVDARLRRFSYSIPDPPPDHLREAIEAILADLEVVVIRVKQLSPGRYVVRWNRRGGALTEESILTIDFA